MSNKPSVDKFLQEFAASNHRSADLYRSKQMHELFNRIIQYVSLDFFKDSAETS